MSQDDMIVYSGHGSSHSWTWLADLFESQGIVNARFLDSTGFIDSLPGKPAAAIVSGGDGFAIGSSLSGKGFVNLKEYISRGGTYVGVCAGAYLPLPSSIYPFSQFNVSSTKIENIDCRIPPLQDVPLKAALRYGSCSIVHPVRGEVDLDHDGSVLKAPIYGGPIFREPVEDAVILRYRDFTPNTEFQFGRQFAKDITLGRPAAIRCHHGDGDLLLLGPHLEHPSYHDANRVFLGLLRLESSGVPEVDAKAARPELARAIADLKVAIVGLENRSFVVGKKLWDGKRYLELVHAVEKRTSLMDDELFKELVRNFEKVREDILGFNIGLEGDADKTTQLLVETTRRCVDNHFLRRAECR